MNLKPHRATLAAIAASVILPGGIIATAAPSHADVKPRHHAVSIPAPEYGAVSIPAPVYTAESIPNPNVRPRAAKRYLLNLSRADRARVVKGYARVLPVCATEDSSRCVWRGGRQGAGQGRSFVTLAGVIFYLNGSVNR